MVNWARAELAKRNLGIARSQSRPDRYAPMNSAFIQFNTQLAAHMACQSVASHRPFYMTPRYLETAPEDVVWQNMQLEWWQRLIRVYGINAALIALVVFYSIPTAFVGSISNITYLTNQLPWLSWIYNLPPQIIGVITGLVPSIMLALWLSIVPFILRFAIHFEGHPTRTTTELSVQTMYFAFLVSPFKSRLIIGDSIVSHCLNCVLFNCCRHSNYTKSDTGGKLTSEQST
jgi:calcium permeable stress-gated cation channel